MKFNLAPAILLASALSTNAAERPNIILAMADDQGWGDVGYYGHPHLKTPVLDEMAASGLRFDQFYAAAPVCSPTRGSVMTGRHPNRFACFAWGHTLRPQEVTVAEALKQAGYTTGHFGKWHLGSMQPDSPVSPSGSGFDEWFSSPNFYENSPLFSHKGKVVKTDGESSMVTVEKAVGFMKQAKKQRKPFLAVIWFGNPHTPHIAAPHLQKMYADHPKRLMNYYGEVTGIDLAMGRLRKDLKEMGIADNTLLWYTSDNGGRNPGSTGGLRGQKGSLWEGGIRVPAIIEWPSRISKPRITKFAASTVDIYPTLLDLTGVKLDHQPTLDGVSLMPLIDGKAETREKPMGFWVYPTKGRPMRSGQMLETLAKQQAAGKTITENAAELPSSKAKYATDDRPGHAAWIAGRFKLHRIPQKNGKTQTLLYDLEADEKEKTDIAAQHEEKVKQMQSALAEWQRSVIGSLNREDYR